MNDLLRRLAITQQGLTTPSSFKQGISGTRQAIEHLGYVQIDTISVVERAHHHVLWNRVQQYDVNHLNQLVQQQQIFEYWFHAASYLPMKDYRYVLPQMEAIRNGQHRYFGRGDVKLMNEIMARAKDEGHIRLRHIDPSNKKKSGGWWNSSLARRSIEQLFMQGDLMICERNGMEKVYSLAEQCIPQNLDMRMPTLQEYARYLFDTTMKAHGIFTWKQLIHLKTGKAIRDAMREIVNEQLDAGTITCLDKLEHSNGIHHLDKEKQNIFIQINALEQLSHIPPKVKILSPFDNLVIHRERLKSLFQYDYRLECYVAAPKRVFGYFCLPILYGEHIVGKMDCKAHRAQKRFEVLSLHLEHEYFKKHKIDRDHFIAELMKEIQSFAEFNQCPNIDENIRKVFL